MTLRTYALQFVLSALYAAALERVRPFYERHGLTELTVIVGVLLALAPAAWLSRREGATWRLYERRVWLGFVVSGAPITAWQAWLWWRGR